MSRNVYLIVNPVSGKGRVKNFLLKIIATLSEGGNPVTVLTTEQRGDAVAFAEKYGKSSDLMVCTGGDGTLNEVISGLMTLPREERPTLGYIPLGTTNDMASTLSIPRSPDSAISLLKDNAPRNLDIGKFNDKYFSYVAAFGAFTEISYGTPQSAKNTFGYLAYIVEALGSLSSIKNTYHAHIEYDDGVIDDDFIFGAVANSTSVAGLVKLPKSDVALDDGLFEVLLIKAPRNPLDLNQCILDIGSKNFNSNHLYLLHTSRISFSFDSEVSWTRDGEDGGCSSQVEITNCNNAISILV